MEQQKKGLADMQEGEFILNESGTFISTDKVEGVDTPAEHKSEPLDKEKAGEKKSSAGPEEKDITDYRSDIYTLPLATAKALSTPLHASPSYFLHP